MSKDAPLQSANHNTTARNMIPTQHCAVLVLSPATIAIPHVPLTENHKPYARPSHDLRTLLPRRPATAYASTARVLYPPVTVSSMQVLFPTPPTSARSMPEKSSIHNTGRRQLNTTRYVYSLTGRARHTRSTREGRIADHASRPPTKCWGSGQDACTTQREHLNVCSNSKTERTQLRVRPSSSYSYRIATSKLSPFDLEACFTVDHVATRRTLDLNECASSRSPWMSMSSWWDRRGISVITSEMWIECEHVFRRSIHREWFAGWKTELCAQYRWMQQRRRFEQEQEIVLACERSQREEVSTANAHVRLDMFLSCLCVEESDMRRELEESFLCHLEWDQLSRRHDNLMRLSTFPDAPVRRLQRWIRAVHAGEIGKNVTRRKIRCDLEVYRHDRSVRLHRQHLHRDVLTFRETQLRLEAEVAHSVRRRLEGRLCQIEESERQTLVEDWRWALGRIERDARFQRIHEVIYPAMVKLLETWEPSNRHFTEQTYWNITVPSMHQCLTSLNRLVVHQIQAKIDVFIELDRVYQTLRSEECSEYLALCASFLEFEARRYRVAIWHQEYVDLTRAVMASVAPLMPHEMRNRMWCRSQEAREVLSSLSIEAEFSSTPLMEVFDYIFRSSPISRQIHHVAAQETDGRSEVVDMAAAGLRSLYGAFSEDFFSNVLFRPAQVQVCLSALLAEESSARLSHEDAWFHWCRDLSEMLLATTRQLHDTRYERKFRALHTLQRWMHHVRCGHLRRGHRYVIWKLSAVFSYTIINVLDTALKVDAAKRAYCINHVRWPTSIYVRAQDAWYHWILETTETFSRWEEEKRMLLNWHCILGKTDESRTILQSQTHSVRVLQTSWRKRMALRYTHSKKQKLHWLWRQQDHAEEESNSRREVVHDEQALWCGEIVSLNESCLIALHEKYSIRSIWALSFCLHPTLWTTCIEQEQMNWIRLEKEFCHGLEEETLPISDQQLVRECSKDTEETGRVSPTQCLPSNSMFQAFEAPHTQHPYSGGMRCATAAEVTDCDSITSRTMVQSTANRIEECCTSPSQAAKSQLHDQCGPPDHNAYALKIQGVWRRYLAYCAVATRQAILWEKLAHDQQIELDYAAKVLQAFFRAVVEYKKSLLIEPINPI